MASAAEMDGKISFWTLCPYCYIYYEYPKRYEECTLQCQSCQRGFHAVVLPSPPLNEINSSLCTWGFFPLGFSGDFKDVNGASSNWNPIAPLFPSSMKESSNRTDSVNAGGREAVERPRRSATGAAAGNEDNIAPLFPSSMKGSSNRTDSSNADGREVVERPRRSATGVAAGNGDNIAPLFPSSMKGSSNRTDSGNAGGREAVKRPRRSATDAAAGNGNNIAPLFPSSMKGSSNRTDSGNAGGREAVKRPRRSATDAAAGNEDNFAPLFPSSMKGSSNRTDSGDAGGREAVKRPRRSATGAAAGNENKKNVGAVDAAGVKVDTSKKAVQSSSSSRRRGAGNSDLNVEFNNDVEEPYDVVRTPEGNATGDAEDDIDWDEFFVGLDDMIRNLPFLNVVEDDKVKRH